METILNFLLKASSGIVLFYIVYWFFLRKETFYKANRWFLLAALLTAVILPLFPIRYSVLADPETDATVYRTIADTFKNIPVVNVHKSTAQGFNWEQALLLIYITGAAIFMLRLLSQTVILIYLMIKYRVKSLDGIRIVENERYGLPFSFFNVVFINPKFHTQEDLPEILAHEKVHISENHWFDLLFIELLTVIFWFNPFIWFFERSIKQNHEYLADKGVLAQGHNTGRYQALLINQLMGMQIIGVTNNLNFALNANRLKMMTKTKTSHIARIKFVWALPALALLLFAFAEPEYQAKELTVVETTTSDANSDKSEEMTIHGKVILKETNEALPGASVVLKGTTIGTVSDRDGTFTLVNPNPNVNSDGSLSSDVVVSFVGLKTVINTLTVSGSQKNTEFTFLMEDAVQVLHNAHYSGDQPPPPPPLTVEEMELKEKLTPPPPSKESKVKETMAPPPPPPPAKNGKEEVFYIVEDMPQYPGGYYAMQDYISKMQQKIAQAIGIKGKAKVLFTINAKGKVTDIKIVDQDNDKVGKAAAEIVAQMPDWKPGKTTGERSSC